MVAKSGEIVWPDRLLILYARDLLARYPGATVLYDARCSRQLPRSIAQAGGQAVMQQAGHAAMSVGMRATGAMLAGDMSGHLYFRDRWYGYDDALYAAARLLEILSAAPDAAALLDALPQSCASPPIRLEMPGADLTAFMDALRNQGVFPAVARVTDEDGLRVAYPDGFGLVRPSRAGQALALRFEADTAAGLGRIQADFRRALARVDAHLALSF